MSGTDYADIMDRSLDEVKETDLVPAGPWMLRGTIAISKKVEYEDENTGEPVKGTKLSFGYEAQEPLPGVDPEAVQAGGFDGHTIWVNKTVKDADSEARALAYLAKHGLDTTGRKWKDILKAFKGSYVKGNVGVRTFTTRDGEMVKQNELTEVAAVS